jgi:cytoskeletal protein RodZ
MINVGQKLREERIRKGLSLDDVAKTTKIRVSFLQAIEKGEYHKLPSSAYAQGFVQNYVEFLALPKKETLALFRREFDEERSYRVLPIGFAKKEKLPVFRFRIHQRVFLILALLLLLFGFILFQYRYIFLAPTLIVSSPKNDMMIAGKELAVTGKTDSSAIVSINGEIVSVDQSGVFIKSLTLFSGETVIEVKAKHRFGKEAIVTRKVRVRE